MKREFLKGLGIEDEAIDKIMEENGKDIESAKAKAKPDEETTKELENLRKSNKEYEKQLETLKKSAGDNEDLKKQIDTLQTENKKAKEEFDKQLSSLRINNAIKLAIHGKVQDEDIVAGLIDKDKIVMAADGSIAGLDEQISTMKKEKGFLFVTDGPEYKPTGGKPPVTNPWKKDSFNMTEQGKIYRENPVLAKQMASEAGVQI